MQNNIIYYQKNNHIEQIAYKNAAYYYPMHTHTQHVIIGYVTDGAVCIVRGNQKYLYHQNECFCIMPDTPHALEPINGASYSMISICVPAEQLLGEWENENSHVKRLKQMILNAPENVFFIEDMAFCVGISPYHMLRRFKTAYGLTPHQFQIQCRVRKAQKLLEEGKSVTEVAYDTGFCDQSHLDRCFRKIVRLTPKEYKRAVRVFSPRLT